MKITKIEENDDPLNTHRQATNETCLQSVLPDYPVTLQQSQSCSLVMKYMILLLEKIDTQHP